eukprot:6234973-Amphidinium_carterae.1
MSPNISRWVQSFLGNCHRIHSCVHGVTPCTESLRLACPLDTVRVCPCVASQCLWDMTNGNCIQDQQRQFVGQH